MTIPYTPFVVGPRILHDSQKRPEALARFDIAELCVLAKIPMRVTGAEVTIFIIAGTKHLRRRDRYYVGGGAWKPTRVAALRVLEVLADGFHDYAARECLNPVRKLVFHAPGRMGRPPVGHRAQTARERMAAMRARRSI
jgi:hypothetical protein